MKRSEFIKRMFLAPVAGLLGYKALAQSNTIGGPHEYLRTDYDATKAEFDAMFPENEIERPETLPKEWDIMPDGKLNRSHLSGNEYIIVPSSELQPSEIVSIK